jgi:TetR/AcrR family transcriptional regulator, regulator of biofilm formation and stress response
MAVASTPRRRHDPERRARIIKAAQVVIATNGVTGTTHRSVAAEADVPLGSTTYHFASLDDLVTEAFLLHVDSLATRFERRLAAADDPDQVIDAVVATIVGDLTDDAGELALTFELYAAAARRPVLTAVTEEWMARAVTALGRHLDAPRATFVDAVIEGLMVHRAITSSPLAPAAVRTLVATAVGADFPSLVDRRRK